MKSALQYSRFTGLLFMCMFLGVGVFNSPAHAGVANPMMEFLSVNSTGCNNGELNFNIFRSGTSAIQLGYSTIVEAGGRIYMDEFFIYNLPSGESNWGIFDKNDRGLQTGQFPMPANLPFTLTFTLIGYDSAENELTGPVWQQRIEVDGCNTGNITYNQTWPFFELILNGGFEKQGGNKATPANWTRTGTTARVCGNPNNPANNGSCAQRLSAGAAPTSIVQVFNRGIGQAGDVLFVAAQARAANLAANARMVVKIRYADNSRQNITLTFNQGTYDYTGFINEIELTGAVRSIRTIVLVAPGSGRLVADDVSVVLTAGQVRTAGLSLSQLMDISSQAARAGARSQQASPNAQR